MIIEYARPVRAGVDTLMHVGEDVAIGSYSIDKYTLIGAAVGAIFLRKHIIKGAAIGAVAGYFLNRLL